MPRILVIEDSRTTMELMVYVLGAFGHVPLQAFDGEEGVDTAIRERPDLIVCDIHLPKLDGHGVLRRVKSHPALRHVPIVAATAGELVGDQAALLREGFDGCISKSSEPRQFIDEVERFLRTDADGR